MLVLSLGLVACTAASDPAAGNPAAADNAPVVDNTPAVENSRAAGSTPTADPSASKPLAVEQEAATRLPESKYEAFQMVTLLPRDAIPAIDDPQFLSSADADRFYDPDELVIGVTFDGDARAYSVPFLSSHEIVNDTVGDVKIAVTW